MPRDGGGAEGSLREGGSGGSGLRYSRFQLVSAGSGSSALPHRPAVVTPWAN